MVKVISSMWSLMKMSSILFRLLLTSGRESMRKGSN